MNYSLVNDLYWIHDGFVGEHLAIALGERSPETLEIHCDAKLTLILQEVLPFLLTRPAYAHAAPILEEIINNFDQNSYLTTNILMPVVIESITRSLAAWVYQQQQPEIDEMGAAEYIEGFLSLENLILKPDWQDDIPMNFYTAVLESKYINDPKLAWAAETLTKWEIAKEELKTLTDDLVQVMNDGTLGDDEKQRRALDLTASISDLLKPFNGIDQQPVMVSIKVKLQFLIRRFKDDRNAIIHGDFSELNKKWKCYINFSALINLYKLILELETLYSKAGNDQAPLS